MISLFILLFDERCLAGSDVTFLKTKYFPNVVSTVSLNISNNSLKDTLRKKCSYSESFWSVFSRIRTEYGKILCIYPYSVQMWENTDQNNSEYGHFLRSVIFTLKKLVLKIIHLKFDIGQHLPTAYYRQPSFHPRSYNENLLALL